MKLDVAKRLIEQAGYRPLETRGFYSHFVRIIDDQVEPQITVACLDISRRGEVRQRELARALRCRDDRRSHRA